MKRLTLYYTLLLGIFLFASCDEEKIETQSSSDLAKSLEVQDNNQQKVISEINIGEKSVIFIANGEHVGILEKYRPGTSPLLSEDFEGLSFTEIHQKLAPSKQVPNQLNNIQERFELKSEGVTEGIENTASQEGNHFDLETRDQPMTTEGLNDIWFRDNYCNPSSFYNGYKACLLNRYGPGTDWGWANCTRSRVYVYPFQGGQVHLQGKVNGSTLFDADLLAGWVYTYYMYSGTNFWGCRQNKQHYYSITQTSGDGWHWSLRSNTDC